MTTTNSGMQQRGDTAANWTSTNPVLNPREIGVETDTRRFKFGDGTTAWNSLAYGGNPSSTNYLMPSSFGAAANTSAVNGALSSAYTAGGGTVLLSPGTWSHTGIVMPPGGTVTLQGSGQDATVLSNTSTTATSISVLGQGSGTNPARPYAQGWTIRDLSCTTASGTVSTGQIGIDIALAVQYTMRSIRVSHHDISYRFNSVWETTHQSLTAAYSGVAGYQFISGYAGSTPVSFNDCNALNGAGVGASFAGDINAVSWFGGDFVANADGMTIQSATARLISIYGTNFEGQSGTDVIVGSSTVASGSVQIKGTRHFRGGAKGTTAINFVNGGAVTVDSAYFSNYTNAIQQSNLTGQLEWRNLVADSTTNYVNSQTNGVFNIASGQITPGGFVTSDSYSGLATSVGLGVKPGDRKLRITSGYMVANTVGTDGDLTINTAGARGSQFYIRTGGVWTAQAGPDPVTTAAINAAQSALVGVNAQTANYTAVLADAGKLITLSSTAALTFTIPTNATVNYPVGTVLAVANLNTGAATIAPASGVTLLSPAGLRITTQYAQASLVKTGTDTWLVSGQTVV